MLQQSIHAKQDVLFMRFAYPVNIIQQIRRPGECVCSRVVYEGLEVIEIYTDVSNKYLGKIKNPFDGK